MHSRPFWKSCPEDEYKLDLSTTLYRRTPWYNHPASKMWLNNQHALALYACHICYEWRVRGYEDNVVQKICAMMQWTNTLEIELRKLKFDSAYPQYDWPPWLGREDIHASHRSNLLRKNFAHYSQFGWMDPATLPYVWPTI